MLYRTTRGWSLTVARLSLAVAELLEAGDVTTPLALVRQLHERTEDLRLLASVAPQDRHSAAYRALLFQALVHYNRGQDEPEYRQQPSWPVLLSNIGHLRQAMPRADYDDVAARAAVWRNPRHWFEDDPQRRATLSQIPSDRVMRINMAIQVHSSQDLYELDARRLGPNRWDYVPSRQGDPSNAVMTGLWVWWLVSLATDACARIFDRVS